MSYKTGLKDKIKVGDMVTYKNPNNVIFKNLRVTKIDGDKYYMDWNCYWSPVRRENLKLQKGE